MVYLIHFDKPYHHACHYLGFSEAESPEARLERHRSGDGAKLLRALNLAGIGYKIVRTWPEGDRNFERSLKNQNNIKRHCPMCKGGRA
jgi:predicted GIY-YIG superfamily endonuclease